MSSSGFVERVPETPTETQLTAFERELLKHLVVPRDVEPPLRAQLDAARVRSREFSGHGFFTNLVMAQDTKPIRLPAGDNPLVVNGLFMLPASPPPNGIGAALFFENGVVSMLDCYAFDDEWPVEKAIEDVFHAVPRHVADQD